MALPYYRRNLYVLWVSVFLVSASWTQVIPFLPLFLSQIGVTDGLNFWSGVVVSAHFVSSLFMLPVWGKLSDRFGRKPMIIRAGLSLSVIYVATSFATQAWHVALLRFLNGALTGFIPMSTALIGTNTPGPYAPRFVASLQTSSAAGSIIGPVIGGTLAGIFGVKGGLIASGTLVFLSTLLALFFVEERHQPIVEEEKTSIIADVRTAFASPVMWVVLFVSMLGQAASTGVQPVLVLHIEEMLGQRANAFLTGMVMALPGIAFVLSATRWVRLMDKHHVDRLIQAAFLGTGVMYMVTGAMPHIWLFAPVFFVGSLFVAAFRPIGAAMITSAVEQDFRGRAFALQTSASTLGGLLGPIVAGLIADYYGRRAVFVALGALLVLSPIVLRRHNERVAQQGVGQRSENLRTP